MSEHSYICFAWSLIMSVSGMSGLICLESDNECDNNSGTETGIAKQNGIHLATSEVEIISDFSSRLNERTSSLGKFVLSLTSWFLCAVDFYFIKDLRSLGEKDTCYQEFAFLFVFELTKSFIREHLHDTIEWRQFFRSILFRIWYLSGTFGFVVFSFQVFLLKKLLLSVNGVKIKTLKLLRTGIHTYIKTHL